jgi:hypothetical protein
MQSVLAEHGEFGKRGDHAKQSTLMGDPVVSEERIFPLMAEVRLKKLRGGDVWVHWFYPPSLLEEIVAPKMWAQVNLDVIRKLRTYAAVMLYLVCVRYQNNPGGVTKHDTVQELDKSLRSRPEKPGQRTWRRLKEDVIKDAVSEINEMADIRFELVEYRLGRAVTHAQFNVAKRAVPIESGPVRVDCFTFIETLRLREQDLRVLEYKFGSERLRAGVERVGRFVEQHPNKRSGNPLGFFERRSRTPRPKQRTRR